LSYGKAVNAKQENCCRHELFAHSVLFYIALASAVCSHIFYAFTRNYAISHFSGETQMRLTRVSLGLGVLATVLLSGGFLLGDDKKPDDKAKPDDPKVKGTLPPHFKSLGLTDKQVQDVYKVQASYKAKIDELEQKIKDLKAEEKVEREKILTDTQKTRLKELLLGEKDPPPDKDKAADKDKSPTDKDKPATDKDKKPADKASDK
jgi:hypothetical protein